MKAIHFSAGLISLACVAAFSQAPQEDQPVSPEALPEAQTQNGISYMCGGIGNDAAASMKQAARQHDLMLTFATREGNYLSDVNVEITDARGRPLLDTTCDGPIMLVDLPKGGRYRISAEVNGKEESGTVQLRPRVKGKRLALAWPREVVPGQS
jgi:hypothetical protein